MREDYIESQLIRECGSLFDDLMPKPNSGNYRVSAEQIAEIEKYVGTRVCRRAMRFAGMRPDPNSDDWLRGKYGGKEPVDLAPEDFGIALDDIDPDNVLGLRDVA